MTSEFKQDKRSNELNVQQHYLAASDLCNACITHETLVGVCVQDGFAPSISVCRTSAASVELLPRGWRTIAFLHWLHAQSCSTWLILILIARCCFGAWLLCVRDGLAALLFANVALLLFPLSSFLRIGAPSLSLGGFMF